MHNDVLVANRPMIYSLPEPKHTLALGITATEFFKALDGYKKMHAIA